MAESDIQQTEKSVVVESRPSTPREDEKEGHDVVESEDVHVSLSWRSWAVVFVACWAVMDTVFIVVGASNVIAFIIRDLGQPAIVGWVIQGPLLVQAALAPQVGRLSDVLDRRYLASLPPIIAFVGAVISAKAQNMSVLIGGGILIGIMLATVGVIQAIPSEVLPMKYRPLANGFTFVTGSIGGLLGVLGGGGLTNASINGWRGIFWLQAGLHASSSIGFLLFYHPIPHPDRPQMSKREIFWSLDPVGSVLFATGAALMLLALDWAGGTYLWNDAHVAVPLALGLFCTVLFALYEWKGRNDGLVAHAFFKGSPNFALSLFAFAVEGWIFYSVVNSVTTQIVLNLGFADSSWKISIRQLSFNLVNIFGCIPITWWATRFKDMKAPLLLTFTCFLAVAICYACITPAMSHAQIGFNVLSGFGQAGPLTLLVALIQFTSPHAYLANATGLAFSARAIGGAFGTAVVNVIINNKLGKILVPNIIEAAVGAGLPAANATALYGAMAAGNATALATYDPKVLAAAADASHHAYAAAYRLAWSSAIPFIVLAMIAVACLKGVKELMTENVEATVERIPAHDSETPVKA